MIDDNYLEDPEREEFRKFILRTMVGIDKQRPPQAADLIITDEELKRHADYLSEIHKDSQQRAELEMSADLQIKIFANDSNGNVRSFDINLRKEPINQVGHLLIFHHNYNIDANDLGKLASYCNSELASATKITYERDLHTGQIEVCTIRDRWDRVTVIHDRTAPSEYHRLYLQAGLGQINVNLSPELQETIKHWQDGYDKDHITLAFEDPLTNERWSSEIPLKEVSLDHLHHYIECREFYHVRWDDISKINDRIKELNPEYDLLGATADVAVTKELYKEPKTDRIEIERDDNGVIEAFTIQDKLERTFVFDANTPPHEFSRLYFKDEYGQGAIELPDELLQAAKQFQEQYEYQHISIRCDDSVNGYGWKIDVNLEEQSLQQLYDYRSAFSSYQIEPQDIVKLDHWINERQLDIELRGEVLDHTHLQSGSLGISDEQEPEPTYWMEETLAAEVFTPTEIREAANFLLDPKLSMVRESEQQYNLDPMVAMLYEMASQPMEHQKENTTEIQPSQPHQIIPPQLDEPTMQIVSESGNQLIDIFRNDDTGRIERFTFHDQGTVTTFDKDTHPDNYARLLPGISEVVLTDELERATTEFQREYDLRHITTREADDRYESREHNVANESLDRLHKLNNPEACRYFDISPTDMLKVNYWIEQKELTLSREDVGLTVSQPGATVNAITSDPTIEHDIDIGELGDR